MEAPDDIAVTTPTIYPDAGIFKVSPVAPLGASVAIAPAPLELRTVIPTPVPHVTIEIRDTAERQLMTAIEILWGEGREEYLTKRRQILLSAAHLLEIDLLRRGRQVPMEKDLPEASYFVFLSRAEKRPRTEIGPLTLPSPLPVVPVPLLPGDRDVALNLQQALTAAYDLLGLDLAIDYTQPPEIPLKSEDAAWAITLLRSAGLRP